MDYDSTLLAWRDLDNQEDISRTVKVLKEAQHVGCYTIISCNCDASRYGEIKTHCGELGIAVDSINASPIDLPISCERVFANIELNDRGGLTQALDILEEATYLQRAHNYAQVHRDEIG